MKVGRMVMYILIRSKIYPEEWVKMFEYFTVCRKDKWQIMQNKYDYLVRTGLYGAVFAHEAKSK